jgi:hypothetical protein
VLSRVCEEFRCVPSVALEELENDVDGLVFKIIGLRAYARAKGEYEAGLKEKDLSRRPTGPLIDEVQTNVFAIARKKMEAKKK